jgi:hypothetical protein
MISHLVLILDVHLPFNRHDKLGEHRQEVDIMGILERSKSNELDTSITGERCQFTHLLAISDELLINAKRYIPNWNLGGEYG